MVREEENVIQDFIQDLMDISLMEDKLDDIFTQ